MPNFTFVTPALKYFRVIADTIEEAQKHVANHATGPFLAFHGDHQPCDLPPLPLGFHQWYTKPEISGVWERFGKYGEFLLYLADEEGDPDVPSDLYDYEIVCQCKIATVLKKLKAELCD